MPGREPQRREFEGSEDRPLRLEGAVKERRLQAVLQAQGRTLAFLLLPAFLDRVAERTGMPAVEGVGNRLAQGR